MSTTTTNFKLIKPELSDAADITKFNSNWDRIDTALIDDVPNFYIWKKCAKTNEAVISITAYNSSGMEFVITYANDITASGDGIALVNPQTLTVTGPTDPKLSYISGKYVDAGLNIYYINTGATFTQDISGSASMLQMASLDANGVTELPLNGSPVTLKYVAAMSYNAYPVKGGHSDGYYYEYIKQLAEPQHTYGTEDLTPGSSELATGKLYFVYE